MADGDLPGHNGHTPLANGLKRDMSVDKELQKISQELETLNTEASRINDLERGLSARRKEQISLEKSLRAVKRKHESSLKKAQPFFKVLAEAKLKQQELREAAERFERASNQLADAKDKMALAEKNLKDSPKNPDTQATDFAWLEVLNNATIKVTEAEKEKRRFEQIHQRKAYELHVVVQEYNTTERKLRSTIRKVRPFLEERRRCTPRIQELKEQIVAGEKEIAQAKMLYSQAMSNLEQMSEQIHRQRKEEGDDQTDFFAHLVANRTLINADGRESEAPSPTMSENLASEVGSICNYSPTPSLFDVSMDVIAQCVVDASVDAAVRRVSNSSPPPDASSMAVMISRNLAEIAIQGAIDVISQEMNHENR